MLVTTNFNARHPEIKPGEVYICNQAEAAFRELSYRTKRLGQQAFDVMGNPMRGVRPVFADYAEILANGFVRTEGGFLWKDEAKAARLQPIWERVTRNVRASQATRLNAQPAGVA